MNKLILAIDPGASGGICFYSPNGVEAYKMPDTPMDTCNIIAAAKEIAEVNDMDIFCVMEEVGGFIQGNPAPGSAMFNFGRGFGQLEGFLYSHGIPFELVRPQKWMKAVGLTFPPSRKGNYTGLSGDELKAEKKRIANLNATRKRDNKNKIKERAQRLYPALKVTLNTADALMLLEYGKGQLS